MTSSRTGLNESRSGGPSGDATTDPAPVSQTLNLSQRGSNLLLVASPIEQEVQVNITYRRMGIAGYKYPIRYMVVVDGEDVGVVAKDWRETGRTRVFEWVTEPETDRFSTRQAATDALLKALQG